MSNQIQFISEYKHPNQKLMYMESEEYRSRKYVLVSYDTWVLEVIINDNNEYMVTIDKTGQISKTTSRHINQCKEFINNRERIDLI